MLEHREIPTPELKTPDDVITYLAEKYKVKKDYLQIWLKEDLTTLKEKFGGLQHLRGKQFLDLGCGMRRKKSKNNEPHGPWLCRALHLLGAEITAVDKDPQELYELEDFPYVQVDLTKSEDLEQFADQQFDIVNLKHVPLLVGIFDEEKRRKIIFELNFQILRLLKPRGQILNHSYS